MENGRPRLYNNVEDMQRDVDNYFKDCDEKGKPYTMSGLAYSLNMSRQSLINYEKMDGFFDTIKKAREKVEQQLEENALMGKGNATFTIFNLKNNFGWKDNIEINNKQTSRITIVNDLEDEDGDTES